MGLSKAARLFFALNDGEYNEKCRKCADLICAEKCTVNVNKRIAALNMLCGRNTNYETDLLSGSSASEMSCFMGYYVLLAKAKSGDFSGAIDIIKSYWGGMLSMGATTFWEDFDIEWMKDSKEALFQDFYLQATLNHLSPGNVIEYQKERLKCKEGYVAFVKKVRCVVGGWGTRR